MTNADIFRPGLRSPKIKVSSAQSLSDQINNTPQNHTPIPSIHNQSITGFSASAAFVGIADTTVEVELALGLSSAPFRFAPPSFGIPEGGVLR